MGYDMYFVNRLDGDEDYFRLNMWGMGLFTDFMTERSMVFDAGKHPEWPDIDAYGVTWDDVERLEYPEYHEGEPLSDETAEKARRYLAERDRLLAWHGPEVPGIPVHKFGSNDGWIVTPAECEAAVRIGREHPAPEGHEKRWAEWLGYMDRARRHGGFEVH